MTVYFEDSPYEVEIEKDLTVKKQLLDIILIERDKTISFDRYPDGLENMSRYNLISYKFLHEYFDLWSLFELLGHYVNYRKQISPSMDNLIGVDNFKLYGITTLMPTKLMDIFSFQTIGQDIFELKWEEICIRLIVLSMIPKGPYNDLWRLFSAKSEVVEEVLIHYTENKHKDYNQLMQRLYEFYLKEELPMSYTREQFEEEFGSSSTFVES